MNKVDTAKGLLTSLGELFNLEEVVARFQNSNYTETKGKEVIEVFSSKFKKINVNETGWKRIKGIGTIVSSHLNSEKDFHLITGIAQTICDDADFLIDKNKDEYKSAYHDYDIKVSSDYVYKNARGLIKAIVKYLIRNTKKN